MKNLKKLLAVIVAICVLATFTVPAFADEVAAKSDAEICEDLGVLQGTTSGVDAEYLEKGTTRIQAAIISLRLAGKEAEALEFEGTETFADAETVEWAGGRAVLAYLKANPDLGWAGSTSGNFFPYDAASAQMIYKVLLEGLGYKQDVDFAWGETLEFAAEKGLVKVADVTKMTNNDMAIAIVEVLKTNVKDSETTLAATLVEAGAIDKDAAIAAGLYAAEATATVAATGAKKLTVTFGQVVDASKVTFTAKKGAVTANIKEVTFAENKKSAELEMAGALTEGTYTVTIKGLGEDLVVSVDVLDEKVTKIEFASDTASLVRGEDAEQIAVGYKVYNQYNEDMAENEGVNVTAGKGSVVGSNPVSGGTITLESTVAAYAIGEKINVTIVHAASGTYASSVLTVGTEARVATIALTSIYHPDDEELVAGETANFYIVVEAKDQYGNVMETPSDVQEDVMITVSNPAVADVDRTNAEANLTAEGDNKVVLKVEGKSGTGTDEYTAGTSTVSLISKTTGKRATFDIVVKEGVKVDTLTLTPPSVFAAGDKDVEIPFTAVDQFGNAVVKNLEGKGITFTAPENIKVKFVKNYVTGNDKLTISDDRVSPIDGTIVISALTGTQKYITLTISVKKAAVPTVVAGIKDFDKVFAKGAKATMDVGDNVIINDQYGREIDLDTYKVKVATSADDKVSVSKADADGAEFEGKAKGSSTITLSLEDGSGDAVKNSAYTFTAKTVEKGDIESFEIAEIDKMYHISGDTHSVSLKVNGVLADGSKVVVPQTGYYTVTENDDKVAFADGKFTSEAGATSFDEDGLREVAFVVTVDAPNGGALVGKLVISDAAPAINKMELQDDSTSGAKKESDTSVSIPVAKLVDQAALDTIAAAVIKSTDQYGVEIDTAISGNAIVTNATDAHTFGAFVAGDTFKVTVITTNNKVLTFTAIVVE